MRRIGRAFLALALALGLGAQDTRVVLVRHGEKASKAPDTELSDLGRRRAEALAGELLPLGPAVLYATERRRTQETLAPLARKLGLTLQVKPPEDSPGTAREILARHRGKVVVVCGHSDTLADLAAGLGFPGDFPPVTGYDGLWVLDWPGGQGPPHLKARVQAFRP